MAIYSLQHRHIGKSTHQAGTASAHIRYITRPNSCSHVLAARMSANRFAAQRWVDEQEANERKNGRVGDKLIIALPRELTHVEMYDLVRDFSNTLTQGRASWLAAFHLNGEDSHNPHVHVFIRDKDPETGKRVAKLSEKGSTQLIRKLWEEKCNTHLALAGENARIDHRTLEEQGIDRQPEPHRGVMLKVEPLDGITPSEHRLIEFEAALHGYTTLLRLEKRLKGAYENIQTYTDLEIMRTTLARDAKERAATKAVDVHTAKNDLEYHTNAAGKARGFKVLWYESPERKRHQQALEALRKAEVEYSYAQQIAAEARTALEQVEAEKTTAIREYETLEQTIGQSEERKEGKALHLNTLDNTANSIKAEDLERLETLGVITKEHRAHLRRAIEHVQNKKEQLAALEYDLFISGEVSDKALERF